MLLIRNKKVKFSINNEYHLYNKLNKIKRKEFMVSLSSESYLQINSNYLVYIQIYISNFLFLEIVSHIKCWNSYTKSRYTLHVLETVK